MKQEHGRRTRAKAKERAKTLQTVFWVGLILVQMMVVNCLQTRAETGEKLVQRKVEKEVRYENMEGAAQLPETIDVEVQESGRTVTVCCTRQESRILREHWEADFRFPVVFHSYDADYYMVGERLIAHQDEQPNLADCEDELLNLIGVAPEEYRIETIEWAGEAYPDADGNLCREALAKGSRLLRDYEVRYVGAVQLPDPGDGAAQELEEAVEESAEELAEEPEEITGAETTPPGVVITLPEAEQTNEEALDFWQKLTRTLLVTIGIGALLFFGGLLFLLILRLVKTTRVCYNERKRKREGEAFYVHRKQRCKGKRSGRRSDPQDPVL
ncbi:MAG: hypothetical protein PHV18_03935 [Lachnospiraceae bacterium]|nr:hypothetical protein [Lachnospiraceae bacterium]